MIRCVVQSTSAEIHLIHKEKLIYIYIYIYIYRERERGEYTLRKYTFCAWLSRNFGRYNRGMGY
jgi:hypothetical protein